MKLHVYQQEKSNLVWVHEKIWTEAEQADMRVEWVKKVDSENYKPIGRGFYRHIKEG